MGLVLVLRIYGALLGAIDSLPLVSGLLELTGVIWLARFGATNLVRSSERQALLSGLQRRWKAFSATAELTRCGQCPWSWRKAG